MAYRPIDWQSEYHEQLRRVRCLERKLDAAAFLMRTVCKLVEQYPVNHPALESIYDWLRELSPEKELRADAQEKAPAGGH